MATNRSLARRGRDLLCSALGVQPPAPDGMLGAMASVPLPGLTPTRAAAERLQTALYDEDRIEVPIVVFPVRAAVEAGGGPEQALVRISAQRYNRQEEYAQLAEVLARRLRGPASPRGAAGTPPEDLDQARSTVVRIRTSSPTTVASTRRNARRSPMVSTPDSSSSGRPAPRTAART